MMKNHPYDTKAISSSERLRGHPEEAAQILSVIRPDGNLKVSAISPTTGKMIVRNFEMPYQLSRLVNFLKKYEGVYNLYFEINPSGDPCDRKSKEKDISVVTHAHLDCDPMPNEAPEDAKNRIEATLIGSKYPPSFIYDSGNGLVALWKLSPPCVLNIEADRLECKALNQLLQTVMGGKAKGFDSCFSIDHLIRIPLTPNLPDKRKIALGRVPVVPTMFKEYLGNEISIFDFPNLVVSQATASPAIGTPLTVDDLDTLNLSDRILSIIRDGSIADDPKPDNSRSTWRFEVICGCLRQGVSAEQVLGVITDSRYAISEGVIQKGSNAEDYARKEIERAQAKLNLELQKDFSSEPIDDHGQSPSIKAVIEPTPYVWVDPVSIPRREWLYHPAYIRKFVGLTTGTGGAGKSSLLLVECISMASGRDLLGILPSGKLNAWYWNGEDPPDELQRRVAAILKHYELAAADIEDSFFCDSGRVLPIKLAVTQRGDTKIATPISEALIQAIMRNKIDVLVIDPFVSSHAVSENDNMAIELVAKEWARIANITNCAIHISHHTRKTGGEVATIEDARGASSLNYAARTRRALNSMTVKEADEANINPDSRRGYFRGDNANSSMIPASSSKNWYQIVSIDLGNGLDGIGDSVGVVTKFEFPTSDASDIGPEDRAALLEALAANSSLRRNQQSPEWAGHIIARVLCLSLEDKRDKKAVLHLLSDMETAGELQVVTRPDRKRVMKEYYEVLDFG